MVQRVNVLTLCDIDPDEADASPTTIALNGTTYQIDLCKEHLDELEEVLQPFFERAQRTGRGRPATRTKSVRNRLPQPARSPEQSPAAPERKVTVLPEEGKEYRARVRRWAQQAGMDVGDRGRLAASVITAYEEARARS